MKSGFVAVIGKPNVGKSSLINALVGEKVSIVSPKAQTTRDRVMGILTTAEYQMVFVDTPGIHKAQTKLGEYMEDCVSSALVDVDAVVIVLDGERRIREDEIALIERRLQAKAPVYIAVNKSDKAGFDKIYPLLEQIKSLGAAVQGRNAVKEFIALSAKTGKNVDILRQCLAKEMKEGHAYFPADEYTDKSERFMICEIIREKTLWLLDEEIPHGVGVMIQSMKTGQKLCEIEADLVCEKESHKPIIIGEKGSMLGRIGEAARIEIEKLLGIKVFLKLFVKVRDDWRNKKSIMQDVGYDIKK